MRTKITIIDRFVIYRKLFKRGGQTNKSAGDGSTTHAHWDHIGGHKYFKDIYVHQDYENWLWMGLPIPAEAIKSSIMKELFTKNPPEKFIEIGQQNF